MDKEEAEVTWTTVNAAFFYSNGQIVVLASYTVEIFIVTLRRCERIRHVFVQNGRTDADVLNDEDLGEREWGQLVFCATFPFIVLCKRLLSKLVRTMIT